MAAPIGAASEPGRKPKVSIFALTTSVTRAVGSGVNWPFATDLGVDFLNFLGSLSVSENEERTAVAT